MMELISDDMLDQIRASETPSHVVSRLAQRNGGFADRTMLPMFDETGDREAATDLMRTFGDAQR